MDFDPMGEVMAWIGAYGLFGLFAVALSERFVPVMPSYGMLLAVGIAAADGTWPLSHALLATIAGSLFSCAACFYLVKALGEARSRRLVNGVGRLFGLSPEHIERWILSFRRNQTLLAFSLQLVPTIRLFAPAFAALLGGSARGFLAASVPGIVVWNGLFIGIGYAASYSIGAANMTVLALASLGALLLAEAALFWLTARIRTRRRSNAVPCAIR